MTRWTGSSDQPRPSSPDPVPLPRLRTPLVCLASGVHRFQANRETGGASGCTGVEPRSRGWRLRLPDRCLCRSNDIVTDAYRGNPLGQCPSPRSCRVCSVGEAERSLAERIAVVSSRKASFDTGLVGGVCGRGRVSRRPVGQRGKSVENRRGSCHPPLASVPSRVSSRMFFGLIAGCVASDCT